MCVQVRRISNEGQANFWNLKKEDFAKEIEAACTEKMQLSQQAARQGSFLTTNLKELIMTLKEYTQTDVQKTFEQCVNKHLKELPKLILTKNNVSVLDLESTLPKFRAIFKRLNDLLHDSNKKGKRRKLEKKEKSTSSQEKHSSDAQFVGLEREQDVCMDFVTLSTDTSDQPTVLKSDDESTVLKSDFINIINQYESYLLSAEIQFRNCAGLISSSIEKYCRPLVDAAANLAFAGEVIAVEVLKKELAKGTNLTDADLVTEIDMAAKVLRENTDLGHGITFNFLDKLEQWVLESLGISKWDRLGRGSFLSFLATHESTMANIFSWSTSRPSDYSNISSHSSHMSEIPSVVVLASELTLAVSNSLDERLCQYRDEQLTYTACISMLSAAEAGVTKLFHVSTFEKLGFGTFLEFFASNESLLQKITNLTSHLSVYSLSELEEVIGLLLEEDGALTEKAETLEKKTAKVFQVANFAFLGFGPSISPYVEKLRQPDTSRYKAAKCINAAALSMEEALLTKIDVSNRDFVIDLVRRCPCLVEIGEWLHWQILFQPTNGSLSTFIHSLKDEEETFLWHKSDLFVRLNKPTTHLEFEKTILSGNARIIAGDTLALMLETGSFANAPISLLRDYFRTGFLRLMAQTDVDTVHGLVLDILAWVPPWGGLRSSVFQVLQPALLDLGTKYSSSKSLEQALFLLAKKNEGTSTVFSSRCNLLHNLSLQSPDAMYHVWADDFWATRDGRISLPDVKTGLQYGPKKETLATPISFAPVQEVFVDSVTPLTTPVPSRATDTNCEYKISSMTPKEYIQYILLTKFPHENDILDRLLEKMSSDIYSEKHHFILELVQNADDNTYKNSIVPSLHFDIRIDEALFIIRNNEVGFSDSDVNALCDADNSTKGAGISIGQKGIGFKSVFVVSDEPEIHCKCTFQKKIHRRHSLFLPPFLSFLLYLALFVPSFSLSFIVFFCVFFFFFEVFFFVANLK